MYSDHYEPLLKENDEKDEIISRLEATNKAVTDQQQVLVSIIRLPRMCSEFHKVMWKKSKTVQKFTETKAITELNSRI